MYNTRAMFTLNTPKLKQLREERKLSQLDLADRLSMDRSTYSKYETGKTHMMLEMALKIATILKVKVSEFGETSSVVNNFFEGTFTNSQVNGNVAGNVNHNGVSQDVLAKTIVSLEAVIRLLTIEVKKTSI